MGGPRFCRNCGHGLRGDIRFCTGCGTALPPSPQLPPTAQRQNIDRRFWWAPLGLVLVAVLVTGYFSFAYTPAQSAKNKISRQKHVEQSQTGQVEAERAPAPRPRTTPRSAGRTTPTTQQEKAQPPKAKGRSRFSGLWEGMVHQPGYSDYLVTLRLNEPTEEGQCGTVDYPTIGCGGKVICKKTYGNTLLLNEELSYGSWKCMKGGTIQMVLIDTVRAEWAWLRPNGKTEATGTVSKRE